MREIGIPCIYGLDQNHGTTYTMGGTLFPQNINVAASFNRNLVREAARITAYETKAAAARGLILPPSTWDAIPAGHAYGRIMAKTATSMQKWGGLPYSASKEKTRTISANKILPYH